MPSSFKRAYEIAYDYSLIVTKKIYLMFLPIGIKRPSNLNRFGIRKTFLRAFLILIAITLTPIGFIRLLNLKVKTFGKGRTNFPSNFRIRFSDTHKSIILLAPIDWGFRHQRPQNLARSFFKLGYSVFYINPTLQAQAELQDNIDLEQIEGVWVCTLRLNLRAKPLYIGVDGFPHEKAEICAKLIEDLVSTKAQSSALVLVQQPSWWPVSERLQGNQIIFDCMDLHSGFLEIDPLNESLESSLDISSDQIIVTSDFLNSKKIRELSSTKPIEIVRNGVDTNRFAMNPNSTKKDVVGYFGALAEWFDIDLMDFIVGNNPQLKFEVVGEVVDPKIKSRLGQHKNLTFYGEVENSKLRFIADSWGVGLIPFKLTPLILATNPVKMYEYASMGIPTVATDIPEVRLACRNQSGLFVSKTYDEFNENLHLALILSKQNRNELVVWGKQHDWSKRATAILEHSKVVPRVSIIVLMWNQGLMTLRCLRSIIERSDYSNLEIIIVDNDSEPNETAIVTNWLEFQHDLNIKYIKNSENLGFASGNNVGLKEATGDYLVVLNNDTEVSPGWIWRSLKHFYRNSSLGILGPSTNNCGNEGRIKLRGNPNDWLGEVVPRFNFRVPSLIEVNTAAFFCVFIPRKVFDSIGLISPEFGRGYFEDDDYCKRVQSLGYRIGIARDVFVYHQMGASFDLLEDSEKKRLFNENKAIYEAKWGKWTPHRYALDSDQA